MAGRSVEKTHFYARVSFWISLILICAAVAMLVCAFRILSQPKPSDDVFTSSVKVSETGQSVTRAPEGVFVQAVFVVENSSKEKVLLNPTVRIEAFSSNGKSLGTERVELVYLLPDDELAHAAQFKVSSSKISRVDFALEALQSNWVERAKVDLSPQAKLTVNKTRGMRSETYGSSFGVKVNNASGSACKSSCVTALFYSAQGKLLTGTTTQVDGIAAKGKRSFDMHVLFSVPDYDKMRLVVNHWN